MSKKPYTAPTLTVVQFKTEHGYALSALEGTPLTNRLELMMHEQSTNNYRETEVFSKHNTWMQEDQNSFWQ